jgi:hypothetical protein
MKYFSEHESKIYVVANWKYCTTDEDVMVRTPLTKNETRIYMQMKGEGSSDTEILKELFPEKAAEDPDSRKIEISIDDLKKDQVIKLINADLGIELDSLEKMSEEDLREMLLTLRNRI